MKPNKIISLLLTLTMLFHGQTAGLLAKEASCADLIEPVTQKEAEIYTASAAPAFTNVPDFTHREYWGGTANSGEEEYGQCNWYVAGVLNQMYGKLPGVDLNATETRYNFKWLGNGAHYAANLVGRWGPGNQYGNPVYFELSDKPADGAVFSMDMGIGPGHTGIVLKTYPDQAPLILDGNFDGPSNTWDYAIKRDWKIYHDDRLLRFSATYAVPVGLAREVQDNWKESGIKIDRIISPSNEVSNYNGLFYLNNSLQAFPADGDKAYPRVDFTYFKTPIDCSSNSLLKRVLYYGLGGPKDLLGSRLFDTVKAKYMNELVQAASFGGDRSHTCFSTMINQFGWDLKAEQDQLFQDYWDLIMDPSLPEPPAEYKVYCLESDELSLRPLMFNGCEYIADQMIDWIPTSRMVFGVDIRGLNFNVEADWMDGDPELGGKEVSWPEGYTSTITALVNGQPTGKSLEISQEHPSGVLFNLPYLDLNTFKLNTITLKHETAPSLWSWPGSMSSLDAKGNSFQYDPALEKEENGQPSISLSVHNYKTGFSFQDVSSSAYYYSSMIWAASRGLTTGKTETVFDPGGSCSRAETVTFLYRLAGSPEIETADNPFKDVKESDYFYKPVLWAIEKGITTGKQPDVFAPGTECTRGDFATFLWRYHGSPDMMFFIPFSDVSYWDYFWRPIGWAYSTGLSTGTSPTAFSPQRGVNRGEVVTFLSRYFKRHILPKESGNDPGYDLF